jgi:hypothetical protein
MTQSSDGSTLRRQVLDVIVDVLSATATCPDARINLLQHLADNPGNPEMALLAHLSDRYEADDRAGDLKGRRQQGGDAAAAI